MSKEKHNKTLHWVHRWIDWFDWDPDVESLPEVRDRRLLQMPHLSPGELEVLRQLRSATWDGNVISKTCRDILCRKGLATKCEGWQVITREGLAVLETLGELKC